MYGMLCSVILYVYVGFDIVERESCYVMPCSKYCAWSVELQCTLHMHVCMQCNVGLNVYRYAIIYVNMFKVSTE